MKVYKSRRSGRVYSEPISIDGVLYIEILYAMPGDPLKKGEIIQWWDHWFPPGYMTELEGEQAEQAISGATREQLGIY